MGVKVGIVGAGEVARRYHFPNWSQVPDLEVAAVCDLDSEKAEAVVATFGGQVFPDYEELIEHSGVDALFIFLPPFAHQDQEILAARKGIPFFVEKPVTRTKAKAREIDAVVRETGVMTSVGYNWRYLGSTERAKDLLGDRTIGMIMGYWLGAARKQLPAGREWLGARALSGGQLVEQSTHIVDMLRYFGGDVESVYCRQALRTVELAGFDSPDVGTLTIQFANGAIGTLTNACMLPRGGRNGVEVFAKGMQLEIRGDGLKVTEERQITEYPGAHFMVAPTEQNPYWKEDTTFIQAVKAGDPSKIHSTYSDAVKSLEVSLAAIESADTGQAIRLAH